MTLIDKKTEKEFMQAMTKTLQDYENVIENGKWKKQDWINYGFPFLCRICLTFRVCCECPLYNCCVEDSFRRLKYLVHTTKDYNNVEPFKERYDYLVKKIKEKGYEYK